VKSILSSYNVVNVKNLTQKNHVDTNLCIILTGFDTIEGKSAKNPPLNIKSSPPQTPPLRTDVFRHTSEYMKGKLFYGHYYRSDNLGFPMNESADRR
jgi:hypothetical protein